MIHRSWQLGDVWLQGPSFIKAALQEAGLMAQWLKIVHYSCKGPKFSSQDSHQLVQSPLNSSARGSVTPKVPGTRPGGNGLRLITQGSKDFAWQGKTGLGDHNVWGQAEKGLP